MEKIMEKLNRAQKMLKFGASKSRIKEGAPWIHYCSISKFN